MASLLHFSPIFLTIFFQALLTSPALSLTCTSQTFPTKYTNCSDLPTLNAFLHWAYDPTKSSFSIAFIAPPAKPEGWIAWGINPTGTGMLGTQALVALKDSNGSLVVKTYNLTSYKPLVETSNLSFKVLDSKAESSNGTLRIFATLTLPENMTALNLVWQVGASVTDGMPQKHAFLADNLGSKSKLELSAVVTNSTAVAAGGAAGADTNGPASAPGAQSGNSTGGPSGGVSSKCTNGVYGFLVIFAALFLGF